MKIDIHIHTKKVKSGDSDKREISASDFCNTIKNTAVKICGITNHNCFDKKQYDEIVSLSDNFFQTWPGVELDVLANDKRCHLIVIVNPKNTINFDKVIKQITEGKSLDEFCIDISKIPELFNGLDSIYIPHYRSKKPSISEDDIQILIDNSANCKRVLKEATNSISAGIYVSHGHKSIYGSDVQDWNGYVNLASTLPDLRLPVESFEQFCLLLERDDSTIKTLLDTKKHEKITINPFKEDNEPITLEIYDDINVLFGSKGTGKTEILKALSEYYNSNGHKTNVYESSAVNLEIKYDLKGNNFELNRAEFDFDFCYDEFNRIRHATECTVTSIKKYYDYFSSDETNKISKRIKINSFSLLDDQTNFKDIKEFKKQLDSFKLFLESKSICKEIIGDELFTLLIDTLIKVQEKILVGFEKEFIESSTIRLFNHLIRTFATEISKKTGQPEKPLKTGFLEYARNRIGIDIALKKINNSLNYEIKPISQFVGNLGEKGNLFCKTILVIHNGKVSDGALKPLKNVNKTPQKNVAKMFEIIQKEVYTDKLFEKITEFNGIECGSTISSIEDLILFKRFFEIDHLPYKPSNGESAMILLHQELNETKEIYLIDEPEKSLGNDYINDFIVPLLKEHAYSGKRVIIATHDANIAVRTLPYNSIYRAHTLNSYNTFLGNPFSNNLICSKTGVTKLDWKEISMRTLEGGKEAFGERGKIYANS